MPLLLLNNHDSFTFNLAELLRSIGIEQFTIISSTELRLPMIESFDRIIFSPGPGLPEEQPAMFGILGEVEKFGVRGSRFEVQGSRFGVQGSGFRVQGSRFGVRGILGVCLGMQAIAVYFGGSLINLPSVVHGQPRKLRIMQRDHFLFKGIPDGCDVGLYHSWAVDPETLPACLEILATAPDGTIMALAHKTLPVCGVQFHPESIMTVYGRRILENWVKGG
jgi:anthranilate/para-aminobenzoate synthase component II